MRRPAPLLPLLLGFLAVLPAAPRAASAADPVELAAVRRLLEGEDPSERAAAVRRLAGRADEGAVRLAIATLLDAHPYVRRAAAGVLGVALEPAVRARLLREAPAWREAVARAEVCRTFALWADGDGRTGLLRALADPDESVRAEAVRFLGEDPDPAVDVAMRRAAGADRSGLVRALALDGLARRPATPGSPSIDGILAQGLRDPDFRVRLSALEGTVAAGGEAAAYAVSHGLTDAVWSVRLAAAESAGAVRSKALLAPLVGALSDPRGRVASAAAEALVATTGIPFGNDAARWKAWLDREGATFEPGSVVRSERVPPSRAYDTGTVRFLDAPVTSGHVAFVIDASGSMAALVPGGGTRWDEVRRELERVIEALGTAAEGNVILFADEAQALFPRAARFAPTAREDVKRRLAARSPGGRTALFDGVALALEDDSVDTVIVLSDGVPSAGRFFTKSDVRAELRMANRWRKARIDVIAVGVDEVGKRWRSFLGELASDHGGSFVAR